MPDSPDIIEKAKALIAKMENQPLILHIEGSSSLGEEMCHAFPYIVDALLDREAKLKALEAKLKPFTHFDYKIVGDETEGAVNILNSIPKIVRDFANEAIDIIRSSPTT